MVFIKETCFHPMRHAPALHSSTKTRDEKLEPGLKTGFVLGYGLRRVESSLRFDDESNLEAALTDRENVRVASAKSERKSITEMLE